MPPIPKIAAALLRQTWSLGPGTANFLKKHRLAAYAFFGLFFVLAIFYVLTLFDPNTLYNSRRSFAAVMDEAFGPDNWRAGDYAYDYRDRTMIVKDLWITGIKGLDSDRLVAHVGELAISRLAWASDLKKLLKDPKAGAPVQALAAKVTAREVRFMAQWPAWRAQGGLESLEIHNPRFALGDPGDASPRPAEPGLTDVWRDLRPERVRLKNLRFSGRFMAVPTTFALNLPSWLIVSPRLGARGLVCAPGSLLAGLGFGFSSQGYALSGRVDELAHDGSLALGALDRLDLRNLAVWLEPSQGPASLARVEKKNLPEPWLEVSLADGAGRYLDFRPLARRLAKALVEPQDPAEKPFEPFALLTIGDALLGEIAISESRLNQLSFKRGGLTCQINRAELSVTTGQEPYALSLRLVDGWYSLAEPEKPLSHDFPLAASDLKLASGRFSLAGQAGFEPKTQSYRFSGTLEMDNLFGLTLGFELGGLSQPLYKSLAKTAIADFPRSINALSGLKDVALQRAQLQLRDHGLTERLLGYYAQKNSQADLSSDGRRDRIIFSLALALTLNLEKYLENSKDLTDLLVNFLRKPGVLTIRSAPSPAISYQGFLAAGSLGPLLDSASLACSLDLSEPLAFKWRDPWKTADEPFEDPVDWLEKTPGK